MRSKVVVTALLVWIGVAFPGRALGPKDGRSKNVAVLLFPGVQIIDYTGPWEVFGHATVNGQSAFRIYSVAETTTPIETAMGMTVIPSYTLAMAPRPDILVLPGGNVDSDNAAVIRWIQESARFAEVVLSVCNGAFFLAKAGLLDGLEATTFAGMIDDLRKAAPKTKVVIDQRFVDNGKIITTAGLSSGIDGALHVIEKLYGKGTAQVAAVGMEYDWRPDSGYARASLADRHLLPAYGAIREFSRTVVRHEGTRDRWETTWRVGTDAAPTAVLEKLDAAFAAGNGWVRQAQRGPARPGSSLWLLRHREGSSWSESTRVERLKGEKACLVTVSIARAPVV